MICPKCDRINDESAISCSYCGAGLKTKNSSSDTYIGIYLIFLTFSSIYYLILNAAGKIIGYEIYDSLKYFTRFLGFVSSLAPLILAFAVKNRTWQIILFILAAVIILANSINHVLIYIL